MTRINLGVVKSWLLHELLSQGGVSTVSPDDQISRGIHSLPALCAGLHDTTT